MAEENKDPKKFQDGGPNRRDSAPKKDDEEKKEAPKSNTIEYGIEMAVIGIILYGMVKSVLGFLGGKDFSVANIYNTLVDRIFSSPAGPIIRNILITYITVVNILSIFFVIMIAYCLIKVRKVQFKWYESINPGPEAAAEAAIKNPRWQRVLDHASSDNPSDWRLAVLEADIVLDDLLDKEGYVGDTIGDKLKKAVRGDFKTLDQAWEAHRIRNAIAHEGSDFVLTQREAQRILGLYDQVFKEFDFV